MPMEHRQGDKLTIRNCGDTFIGETQVNLVVRAPDVVRHLPFSKGGLQREKQGRTSSGAASLLAKLSTALTGVI